MKNQNSLNIRQCDNSIWQPAVAAVLALLLMTLAPPGANAQQTPNPPGQVSYQGFLTDAGGVPLATNAPKNYVVTFTIYDAAQGGNIKWAENQTVTVDRGYFSVLLGQGTPSGSLFWTNNLTTVFSGPTASTRFIGLTVAGLPGQSTPSEIQPRLQLLSQPYSLLAANANAISDNAGAQVLTTSGASVAINATPNVNDALYLGGNEGINGNYYLQLGQGIGGQDGNAGKIGYELFDNFALDIVGAGASGTSTRYIKLWAESGTSTTGPLGVGIDHPVTKLDVNGGGFFSSDVGLGAAGGRKGISIFYDNADNTGQIQSIQPGTVNENLSLNANGGNVGIGILNPAAKLEVNGNSYLDGYAGITANNVLEFGRGVAGKQTDAGKIGYGTFTANTLDIVGAGPANPGNRYIKLWAEGGTTTSGPIYAGGEVTAPSINAGGSATLAEGVFYLSGAGHLGDNKLYIRGGTDHNHWIGYDNSIGTDGVGIVGNVGGMLGNTVSGGGYQWDCYWYNNGEFVARGPVYATGGAYVLSDKNAKQDFEDLDAKAVLDKVSGLSVSKWSYTNTPTVKHVGPMAQDFAATFGYGMIANDNKSISLNDEIGVSLAAIKGLNQKVDEKDAEVQALKKEVAELKVLVESLAKGKTAGQ